MNVTVGQTVYLEPRGNAARRSKEIQQAVVSKVGRKYFTVEDGRQFHLDSGVHNAGQFTGEWKAYESLEEIENKRLANSLHDKIKKEFSAHQAKHSLSDLKAVAEILKIEY